MSKKAGDKNSSITSSRPDQLDELLRDKPSDEKQGVNATLGFTFQQWWAALSVAELLAQPSDFAVGIEVKEDVVLLDSATQPSQVEFCQIKKNEQHGAWTLKGLHTKGARLKSGEHPPSTLAKLYKRRQEFSGHPTKLKFISNVGYKVPAEDGSLVNSIDARLDDLTESQQSVVKKAIASQIDIDADIVDLKDVSLHKTNLPLGEQEIFVGGKLSVLCEDNHLPFPIPQPRVAAQVLASELQSRAANTSYARTFSDMRSRLMSKEQAISLLAKLSGAKPTLITVLDSAIDRLNTEGHDFLAVKAIKSERITVCTDVMNRTNLLLRNLVRVMIGVYTEVIASSVNGEKLGELMCRLVNGTRAVNSQELEGRSQGYINAIALLVLNDGIDIHVFTASADTESEAAQ